MVISQNYSRCVVPAAVGTSPYSASYLFASETLSGLCPLAINVHILFINKNKGCASAFSTGLEIVRVACPLCVVPLCRIYPLLLSLTQLFKPMLHIILLIWKNSKHYNTPARLVVLMREICNSLIIQACKYSSGEQIFTLIEQEDAAKAVDQLKTTLLVCGTFKSTYFDYKATANAECPANPWRIQVWFSKLHTGRNHKGRLVEIMATFLDTDG